jgi:hypothetical protein
MIQYEDLCAALESYAARARGGVAPAKRAAAAAAVPAPIPVPTPAYRDDLTSFDAPARPQEPPLPVLRSSQGEEESTHVGQMPGVQEDNSNELDIGDVLSDEEIP